MAAFQAMTEPDDTGMNVFLSQPLNQRVQGSRSCAPTSDFDNQQRPALEVEANCGEILYSAASSGPRSGSSARQRPTELL